MNVLAVFCHPNADSFCAALLERFVAGAEAAGHMVEVADLYREGFDPAMSLRDLQQFDGVTMPPEILAEQARIENADALCLVFPLWWWGMPAMLKGWLDRVWSAGWAYEREQETQGGRLASGPCTMLVSAAASDEMMAQHGYDKTIEMLWRQGIFENCGVEPTAVHLLDSVDDADARAGHLETAYRAGLHCMQAPQDLDS